MNVTMTILIFTVALVGVEPTESQVFETCRFSNLRTRPLFLAEGGEVESPRAFTPRSLSKRMPSPIGLSFQNTTVALVGVEPTESQVSETCRFANLRTRPSLNISSVNFFFLHFCKSTFCLTCFAHTFFNDFHISSKKFEYPRRESNPHALRHIILSDTRLPIPSLGQIHSARDRSRTCMPYGPGF